MRNAIFSQNALSVYTFALPRVLKEFRIRDIFGFQAIEISTHFLLYETVHMVLNC